MHAASWWKSDVASLVQHANNLNVAKHLRDRFPHPYTRAHAFAFLAHAAASRRTTNFAIVVDGEAVGGIGYVRGSRRRALLGGSRLLARRGILGPRHRDRGAPAADTLPVREVKLLRLFALPLADNAGSIRVLEKAGYEREALLRASCVKYGERRDQLLYARINADWNGAVRRSGGVLQTGEFEVGLVRAVTASARTHGIGT